MVRKLFVVMTVALVSVIALPAAANGGRLHDPRFDVRNAASSPHSQFDITWVKWGHRLGGFSHVVHVRGTIGHIASGMGALPIISVKVPHVNSGNSDCDYIVEELPPNVGANTTDHWKYAVETCSNTGNQEYTGRVAAKRLTKHNIRLVFWPKAIGSPAQYSWAVSMPLDTDTPPADRAPDRGYETHNVG